MEEIHASEAGRCKELLQNYTTKQLYNTGGRLNQNRVIIIFTAVLSVQSSIYIYITATTAVYCLFLCIINLYHHYLYYL